VAAGVKAVTVALERGIVQAGVARTVRSMLRVNRVLTPQVASDRVNSVHNNGPELVEPADKEG
jgi:hypothetical protein